MLIGEFLIIAGICVACMREGGVAALVSLIALVAAVVVTALQIGSARSPQTVSRTPWDIAAIVGWCFVFLIFTATSFLQQNNVPAIGRIIVAGIAVFAGTKIVFHFRQIRSNLRKKKEKA